MRGDCSKVCNSRSGEYVASDMRSELFREQSKITKPNQREINLTDLKIPLFGS
jgi:hypothetical protein